jgi:hypothetical protein
MHFSHTHRSQTVMSMEEKRREAMNSSASLGDIWTSSSPKSTELLQKKDKTTPRSEARETLLQKFKSTVIDKSLLIRTQSTDGGPKKELDKNFIAFLNQTIDAEPPSTPNPRNSIQNSRTLKSECSPLICPRSREMGALAVIGEDRVATFDQMVFYCFVL